MRHRLSLPVLLPMLLLAMLLVPALPASAAPGDGGFMDDLSLGTGLIYYGRERVYHATTRCRQLDYRDCGNTRAGQPGDRVKVFRESPYSGQVLLDYHPFGRPALDDNLLEPQRLAAQVVTSYGALAEDKKIIDGAGLGYTLASADALGRLNALTLTYGGVYITDMHTMRPGDHAGHTAHGPSPTEHGPGMAQMLTLSLGL